jgi:hypothetical protein
MRLDYALELKIQDFLERRLLHVVVLGVIVIYAIFIRDEQRYKQCIEDEKCEQAFMPRLPYADCGPASNPMMRSGRGLPTHVVPSEPLSSSSWSECCTLTSSAAMGNAAVEWGGSADCAVGGAAPGKSYKGGVRAGATPPAKAFVDCSRARARRVSQVMGE